MQFLLEEKLVMEGATAWKQGPQRWRVWNALLQNHVQRGRLSIEEQEAHVEAAMAMVRAKDREWLDDPDIR